MDVFDTASGLGADVGPWFTAGFNSVCGGGAADGCGDLIEEGDRVRYVDGVVVCQDCGSED